MVILFTSNVAGGIVQFTIQILRELKNMKMDVLAYIPKRAEKYINEEYKDDVVFYDAYSILRFQFNAAKRIGKDILGKSPQLIWYMDNVVNSTYMGMVLAKNVKQILTLHDLKNHPTHQKTIKRMLITFFEYEYNKKFVKMADFLLCMSKDGYKTGLKMYPKYKNKIVELTLGAHVPEKEPKCPVGLNDTDKPFFLFFGRLDKYKGIATMLEAYALCKNCNKPLVIAGKGYLTEKESQLINMDKRVHLVNRYIEDEEMIWLFQNAVATILPYIEASQSGVIPISYLYRVPVITSNVEGLTQYVEHEKTGFICRNLDDYRIAFEKMNQKEYRAEMSCNCNEYHNQYMNWNNNIKKLFDIVLKT